MMQGRPTTLTLSAQKRLAILIAFSSIAAHEGVSTKLHGTTADPVARHRLCCVLPRGSVASQGCDVWFKESLSFDKHESFPLRLKGGGGGRPGRAFSGNLAFLPVRTQSTIDREEKEEVLQIAFEP